MCEHVFVRWKEQSVDREAARSLPGLDVERVRTFDAPQALGINFHEVRAKSALNRVPGTYLPFNWTVNPYRGCSHACTYCMDGETPILMADGRTKPLAEISIGDAVYGTVRAGSHRRYAITDVRAHWEARRRAYRVTLEDGTELIASGDHRLLTDSGWKHVADAERGSQRAHLTANDELLGPGALGSAAHERPEYRRGHLCDPFLSARGDLGREAIETDGYAFAAPGAAGAIAATHTSARGEAEAAEGSPKLGVASIEPLGRSIPMFDITTGTGDFIANGVVSHNCFARNSHTYLDLDAGRDFEREIIVKVNVPELLAAELRRPSWKGELVAFGTNTDPYQWAEGRYRLMPPMIEALRETGTPTSILTKSPLVLRDLEALKELAEVADVSVNFSVPTLEERAWRETEPHTPHPRKRLEAVATFNQAGIPSGVLIAPLMPGINDQPDQVEEIVEIAKRAGATFVNGIALHLRPGVREVFMSWLSATRPDLVRRYEELYSRGSYADPKERRRLGGLVKNAPCRAERFVRGRDRSPSGSSEPAAPEPAQGSLF